MNIAKMVEMVDRDTLYELLSEWERRVKEEDAPAIQTLYALLRTEIDREYEKEREAYAQAYEDYADDYMD
jgi:hypothetical protein